MIYKQIKKYVQIPYPAICMRLSLPGQNEPRVADPVEHRFEGVKGLEFLSENESDVVVARSLPG